MPPVLDQNDIAFLDSCIHDYERLHGIASPWSR